MTTYVSHAGDTARDRELVIDVWRGNLGREARLQAKFDWFYRGCPWGAPLLQLLRHEPSSAWVGVAGAGPRRMLLGNNEIKAGVLVDLTVLPDHRSLGPALALQKALVTASGRRFDLLYGFPNPKAAAVFKRVGYSQLGELVRYVRVLRYRGFLERKMPSAAARPLGWALDAASRLHAAAASRGRRRLSAEWRDAVDSRVDRLWSCSEHGAALIAPRNAAFLRWRFDQAPVPRIRYLLLGDRRGDALLAWFACEGEGSTLHVRDFWSVDAARSIGRPFIGALLRAADREGYASVSVEYAGAASRRRGWLKAGFVARTSRPVFGKWWRGADAAGGEDNLHLTSADQDE
ncbi:MAG: hypothetical protein JWL95_152 [Gemmatimonadetes bacterium]|nr:hypothetical protein [Gemmatimonadota bacterium]